MPEMPCNRPRSPSPRLTSPANHRSEVFSSGWGRRRLKATVPAMVMMIIIAGISLATLGAQQRAPAPQSGEQLLPGGGQIRDKFINFDQERVQLTVAYRRAHQAPEADGVIIQPRMIILHWTGIPSFASTWNYFNRDRAEAARTGLAAAGEVNVSAQFLVDRDGVVYRLMP